MQSVSTLLEILVEFLISHGAYVDDVDVSTLLEILATWPANTEKPSS